MIASDEQIEMASEVIERFESDLDEGQKVVLVTWSPKPDDLPDSDFCYQHLWNVNILAEYLQYCQTGLWCVEASKRGNPHYHGWFVIDEEKEPLRVAISKVLDKTGQLKYTDCITYKIFNFSERKNGLHYYKKDITTWAAYPHSVISRHSRDETDWDMHGFFFIKDAKFSNTQQKMSDRQFYLQFYKDSN